MYLYIRYLEKTMKWDNEIEKLKNYVFVEKLSYEEIGRIYGCSGNNIKRVLIRRDIVLPTRSKNKGKEPINKGSGKKLFCANCGIELNISSHAHKFCSNFCQQEYNFRQWVEQYKQDNSIAKTNKWGQIPSQLKRYIFNKFENRCCECGWNKINHFTNTLPLEIDHIDGNSDNNQEDNLRLLCPNCHSLTPTYRGANVGHGRKITWILKD